MSRGRPRSADARLAVLEAALLLCQRDGYQQLTIKGIAEAAGVGRQTVYRWWPTKADVLIEALRELAVIKSAKLDPDSGDALRDVRTLLTATFELTNGYTGQALVGLMAAAQGDPELADRLQGTVIGPRREALRCLLQRGVDRGQLGANVPLPVVVDMVFGTMWYRLFSRHAPVSAALADEIVTVLGDLLRREAQSPPAK
jgi:AcrR family transcriptional regulator